MLMSHESERPKFQWVGTKAIRFDRPPDAAEAAPAVQERAGWLELFRAWFAQSAEDRRLMPRHQVARPLVWLGWSRGNEAYFSNPARLANISRGGALVFVADPPPEGVSVWICLGEPEPSLCLEATALEVRTASRKECTVRLRFREPCPHAFFNAAVCLIAPSKSREGTPLEAGDHDA
jgi:hypothetical protein